MGKRRAKVGFACRKRLTVALSPVAVFANQVLLHDEFSIGVEWFADMREHGCIDHCEIAGNADCANLDPLKLVQVACALKAIDESVLGDPIPR